MSIMKQCSAFWWPDGPPDTQARASYRNSLTRLRSWTENEEERRRVPSMSSSRNWIHWWIYSLLVEPLEKPFIAEYINYSMIVFVCNISWRCNSKSLQYNWILEKVSERSWNYIFEYAFPSFFLRFQNYKTSLV